MVLALPLEPCLSFPSVKGRTRHWLGRGEGKLASDRCKQLDALDGS